MSDLQLLEQYVGTGSSEAFAQLVARHADWVYSLALRQVQDRHLAEDVTQAVFLVLAQKARGIKTDRPLNAWLFKVARYSCAHALRAQARREHHEREAAAMNSQSVSPDEQQVWEQVGPQLEQVVEQLASADRDAILLRFYQRKSMAEVGLALGVSEDAAKKRVAKAIERLRGLLASSHVIVPVGALAGALLSHVTHSVPASVVATCSTPVAAGAAFSIAKGVIMIGIRTKLVIAALAGVALAGGLAIVIVGKMNETPPTLRAGRTVVVPASQPLAASQKFGAAAVPATTQAFDAQRIRGRVQCAQNLRQIGLAIVTYAAAHRGSFPDDLATIASARNIGLEMFICPNSGNGIPPDKNQMTPQQIDQWINAHSDYIYLGKGLSSSAGPNTVVAYEKAENEQQYGMNILFGDMRVNFFLMQPAQQLLNADARARMNGP